MTRLGQLEREITNLQAMIEGLEILADTAVTIDNSMKSYAERRAGNALIPLIEAVHAKSEAILQDVGQLALEEHKAARKGEAS